ncbi:MAG: peptidoglycan DD-metalloendopeptidase family protein [Peptococcaceae bacterium]|nr:peptidoglycan DD-metalloendopeptidase family protein [Peptococcaceae bacterium]
MITVDLDRQFRRFIRFVKHPKEPAAIIGVAFYTVFIMFLVAMISAANMMWGVFAGERLISVVADPTEARGIIEQLIEENSDSEETATQLARIYLKKTRLAGPVMEGKELQLALMDAVTSRVKGTEIVVDGRPLLAMKSRTEAEQLLNSIKAAYAIPEGSTRFVEDIRLVDTLVDRASVVSAGQAMEIIKKGSPKAATYQVNDGDTLWGIANKLGIPVEKLIASNSGLDPESIKPGDTINLDRTENLINVETVLTKVAIEQIDYPVEEKKDPSLYLGERKILAQGKNGKREATYQITLVNGVEVERRLVHEVVLDQPQPKVVVTGTRVLLASRGSGSGRLAWPAAGSVVSPYGKRGREFHPGIDIGASYGAPVGAAESGTVTRAGWYGGYGKCVDISHGDGVVTRYGHLSSINVQVGRKVSRGQLIGKVGSTGYSTGPHLHFEVMVNGRRINPMNYL